MLNSDELIRHMKSKNIQFRIMTEEEAKEFIENNTYFYKIYAYRKNYEKYQGKKSGKYKDLDFAYLKELSTLDMHLRYFIIKMCLDIEHTLKLKLLHDVEENPFDDGYKLVHKFIEKYPRIGEKINKQRTSSYGRDIISKYYPDFPIWTFVELISFGDLTHLCAFNYELYKRKIYDNKFLNAVRDLRNAAAHNNCLIYNLKRENVTISTEIVRFARAAGNGKDSVNKKLSNRFLNDFVTLLYVYDSIGVSPQIKYHRLSELKELMTSRFLQHKEYFIANSVITSSYLFIMNILDKMVEQ